MTYRPTLIHWLVIGTLLSTAGLFVPVLFGATFLTKFIVVLVLALTLTCLLALNAIRHNHWQLSFSAVTVGLLGLTAATLLSIFVAQPYPAANLFGLGGFLVWSLVATWLAIQLLLPQAEAADEHSQLVSWSTRAQYQFLVALGLGVVVLAITSVLQQFGIGPSKWFNAVLGLNLPNDLRLSLAGSPLAAAQLGGLAVLGWGILSWRQRRVSPLSLICIIAGLITAGLNTWAMLPGHVASIVLPNWLASWSVALDVLRAPRTALIGVGTDNYGDAFTLFRPVWLNGQTTWQVAFGSASNWPLTLLVTQGLVGLIAWLWLVISTGKLLRQTPSQLGPLSTIIIVSFIFQLAMPLQVGVLIVQLLAIAYVVCSLPSSINFIKAKPRHWWPALLGWLLLIGVGFVGWYYGKLVLAYYHLYQADRAAFQNAPAKLYDQQRQATVMSPRIDLVRREYAVTNLRLALALSSNKNITDSDRTQVTQLVGQAIREAKAATILDANNTQNWLTLAEIYRNLTSVTKDAGQWQIAALTSAIQTDPTNPILRLNLGLALLNQGSAEQAAQSFNQTIELKPDLPGGYYQLGQVFRTAGQFDKTKTLWQKAQSLLSPNSEEYRMVTSNLKDLDSLIAATMSAKKASTTSPVPTITPAGGQTASESALLQLTKNVTPAALDAANPPALTPAPSTTPAAKQ
jgi:tetratricopeptide (TPR) repeat protein